MTIGCNFSSGIQIQNDGNITWLFLITVQLCWSSQGNNRGTCQKNMFLTFFIKGYF